MKDDYTVSLSKANWISIALLIPLSLLFGGLYFAIWNLERLDRMIYLLGLTHYYLLFLGIVVAGIILHELLHGITWMIAGGKKFSDIKFGYNVRAFAPYAHCRKPLDIRAYRAGAAMPGILLGILPYLVSLATGNGWLLLFGFIFSVMATGDAIILWVTKEIDAGTLVKDHPSKAGCRVIENSEVKK